MNKFSVFTLVLACLVAGCTANVYNTTVAPSNEDGGGGATSTSSETTNSSSTSLNGSGGAAPTGCDASPYTWGDEVLFVCANELPLTEVSGEGYIQVLSIQLVNYRGLWNHVGRVCIQQIGELGLEGIQQLTFDVLNWTLDPVTVTGPWPVDGKVCADISMTIGAESQETLFVSMHLGYPFALGEYQFAITTSSDIVIDDDLSEPIAGDFPVQGEVVTVLGD